MESRRFDQLTISLATGSSRRRALAGLGAIVMGTLLGRHAEAKPSGNKGKSGTNGNADCNAVCAHEAKVARKKCQDKDKKAAKKQCLKNVKQAQAECRAKCVPTDNTGTGSTPTEDAGTDTSGTDTGGDLSILAKDLCQPGDAGDAYCQSTVEGTCLIGTCTHLVRRGQYRCAYTRNPEACTDPEKPVCCNYRLDSPTSGQCVQAGPEGNRTQYCTA